MSICSSGQLAAGSRQCDQFFLTMTVNEPVAVLPALSEAEHETVVVATFNLLPDPGEHCTRNHVRVLCFEAPTTVEV